MNRCAFRHIECQGFRVWLTALTTILLVAAGERPASEWETAEEHWYHIEIAGAPAGWSRTAIARRDNQRRTIMQTEMQLRRGETVVEVSTQETFIEQADGTPVRMKRIESSGAGSVEHEWRFEADRVSHIVRQFGRETKRELSPPDGIWLTPQAAERFVEKRRDAGANEITYRTISPESGLVPLTVTMRRLGDDELTIDGRTLPVSTWQHSFDGMPFVIVEHVSSDGLTLKKVVEIGPTRMVMRRSSREAIERFIARGEVDGAPELLISNLVTPDRSIRRVHETRRATFRVRGADGGRPSLPEAGAQRVADDDDDRRAVIVTLDVDHPVDSPMDQSQRTPYLAASSMLDFKDDRVRQLATVESSDEVAAVDTARMLRRRVYRHITVKSLDTGFASASETARMRRGDCTEHAVLLTALLRANDIPARVAMGLVYADHFAGEDHVFGWHMWTQAWIDGKWWDFDAVLPNQRFHAGYVLVSTTALHDDQRHVGLDSFIQLLGSIEIDVLEVTHDENTTSNRR